MKPARFRLLFHPGKLIAGLIPGQLLDLIPGLTLGLTMVVLCLIYVNCSDSASKNNQAQDPARPIKTMTVASATVDEVRTFPGVVKATRETDLAFRVGGPLISFDVRNGQHLKKGDVIARIDPRDYEVKVMRVTAALEEVRANLRIMKKGARPEDLARLKAEQNAASARLAAAQDDYERYRHLYADNATSKAMFDKAKTALDTAVAGLEVIDQELKKASKGARIEEIEATEARLKSLSADLQASKNALSDVVLTAPFDGYVSNKFVEAHENVKAGEAVVSLQDYSSVEVRTVIPEDIIIRQEEITDTFCTLESYPNLNIKATIEEIGRRAAAANQSYPMSVVLHPSMEIKIESGMAATVHLVLQKGDGPAAGFLLPASAIFSDNAGNSCVWRVDPKKMTANKVLVKAGALQGDMIRITEGLNAGDRIAIAGVKFLREGQAVRFLNPIQKEQV